MEITILQRVRNQVTWENKFHVQLRRATRAQQLPICWARHFTLHAHWIETFCHKTFQAALWSFKTIFLPPVFFLNLLYAGSVCINTYKLNTWAVKNEINVEFPKLNRWWFSLENHDMESMWHSVFSFGHASVSTCNYWNLEGG